MILRRTLLLVMVVLSAAGLLHAQQKDMQIVKGRAYLAASALRPGSRFQLAVILDIEKEFHIGAAVKTADWPAKLELYAPSDISFDPPRYPKERLKALGFSSGKRLPIYDGRITIFVDGHVARNAAPGKREIMATFAYQGCSETECLPPQKVTITLATRVAAPGDPVVATHAEVFGSQTPANGSDRITGLFGRGMMLGLLGLFVLGMGLSLTPCVYPMVPITVGFFGMQTERRTGKLMLLAGLYVLGLALTYSVVGLAAALTGGMFGSALQSPWVTMGIALVLVALALSMFGLYEIRAPSSIAARLQDKRGPIGALLMGLLFGLVAAPCIGPMTVALMVYVGKLGSPLFGFLSFFSLALGLGVPVFMLATFSGSISRLPQAGMWMVSVRKILGLLLLGAAIYYVTPLIGQRISEQVADLALPIFVMISGIYLGLFEKALGRQRSLRFVRQAAGLGIVFLAVWIAWPAIVRPEPMKFEPYNDKAVARAALEGKPVMIDFSAEWCPACRETDHKTFPSSEVKAQGERFVRLRADQTDAKSPDVKARERKYEIRGLPTIVFLDSRGEEVRDARVVGFVKPGELVRRMRMAE